MCIRGRQIANFDSHNAMDAYKVISLLRDCDGCDQWHQRCGQVGSKHICEHAGCRWLGEWLKQDDSVLVRATSGLKLRVRREQWFGYQKLRISLSSNDCVMIRLQSRYASPAVHQTRAEKRGNHSVHAKEVPRLPLPCRVSQVSVHLVCKIIASGSTDIASSGGRSTPNPSADSSFTGRIGMVESNKYARSKRMERLKEGEISWFFLVSGSETRCELHVASETPRVRADDNNNS
jgi:hypothetical protein